jgi:hypothetical protein
VPQLTLALALARCFELILGRSGQPGSLAFARDATQVRRESMAEVASIWCKERERWEHDMRQALLKEREEWERETLQERKEWLDRVALLSGSLGDDEDDDDDDEEEESDAVSTPRV